MNNQYHYSDVEYNTNAQHSRSRAQTAPSSSTSPPVPPRPPPPPLPTSLIPGFVRPFQFNSRADLAFETHVPKDWRTFHSNSTPLPNPHEHIYGAPPVPPRPPPVEALHRISSPPIPPKDEILSARHFSLGESVDSLPDISSPAVPRHDPSPPFPPAELPPPPPPPSVPQIDTNVSGSSSVQESQEEPDQSIESTSSITEESPVVDSPVDDDLAEAIRRSLMPGSSSKQKKKSEDDEGLAIALSSLANEDAQEAEEKAERERLDAEFARKLQLEMESEQRISIAKVGDVKEASTSQLQSPKPGLDPAVASPTRPSDISDPPPYFQTIIPPTPSTSSIITPTPESSTFTSTHKQSVTPDKQPSRPESPNPLRRAISANAAIETPTITSKPVPHAEPQPPELQHSFSVQSLPPKLTKDKAPVRPMSAGPGGKDNPVWRPPRVDPELLRGVSFGFTTPPTIADLQPMMGVIPDVIHLPCAPGPPFHLQARSWRSLLRLLARLDSTRLEPSVEAMAVMKLEEAQLRTVIQFNKIEYSPNDWRVVVYLTLDHALPQSARGLWKYTNGDTTTLPYSYILCSPPRVFHNSDATQFYTVPATNKSPYPTLPMSFSNLALYLQSALEDSRKALGDSSGGGRRLAKMVDQYYPDEMRGAEDEAKEGNVMKRVWAGLRKTKDRGRGGNEEMYDLVTPFIIDEYA